MSDIFLLAGILLIFVALILIPVLIVFSILKKNTKRIKHLLPVFFVCGILCIVLWQRGEDKKRQQWQQERANYEPEIQTEPDFEVCDGEKLIDVETYKSDKSGTFATVFDSEYLYLLFGNEKIEGADCKRAILENENISDKFKKFFCDFVDRMTVKYPDMNFEILYHNLQGLKVVECEKNEYVKHSLDYLSLGVYRTNENVIYIPEGTEYIEGEWGFQVLIHEFCHAARLYLWSEDDKHARFNSTGGDETLEEAMNSVFSCSLLNYDERDSAYQTPSNYLRIMLECMDNYELSDYINHSDAYFLQKLDECTGYMNYAQVIWKLIALQRNDKFEDDIDIDAKEYNPIYDYLCKLYYQKYVTPDMTMKEARTIADELIEKAFFDTPEGYKINRQRFYENLEEYINQ